MTSTPAAHSGTALPVGPAIAKALATVRSTVDAFARAYPDDTTLDGRYAVRPAADGIAAGGNRGWTTSFVPGMQWIAWQLSGDDSLRDAALAHAGDFVRRVRAGDDLETHDLGFLYTLSCVAAWRLVGDEESRAAALLAADHLMSRLLEPAGIIQAWGDLSDPDQRGRTIIDSLMNMPLLSWAAEQTGDDRYADAVRRHTAQLRDHIIRDDDSTFHTFYWDVTTGEPLRGATEQGAHDDSCWARGQAWGIYGFALNYRATGDTGLLDAARRCADHLLSHLPADSVPYWDLAYGEGSSAPRDSSAAAITVCGLFELADLETDASRAARYAAAADTMLDSLIRDYAPERPADSDALLLHGVYDLPKGVGVDEGTLWGDYFYIEALARRAALPGWRAVW